VYSVSCQSLLSKLTIERGGGSIIEVDFSFSSFVVIIHHHHHHHHRRQSNHNHIKSNQIKSNHNHNHNHNHNQPFFSVIDLLIKEEESVASERQSFISATIQPIFSFCVVVHCILLQHLLYPSTIRHDISSRVL
jgi:hypothetical protein